MSRLDYEALADVDLVQQVQRELPYKTAGFVVLMRRHEQALRRVCAGILVEIADLDDVQQDVMLNVFHKLGKFEQRASFRTWLTRIAMNQCFTYNRKAQSRSRYVEADGGEILESTAAQEERSRVATDDFYQLLASLSGEERNILTLKFAAELEFGEIAQLMDMKLSATKMRYYRALDKLRASIDA